MARRRARLDSAAIAAAFAPDGLHGATAAQIAQRAGIAKPTLYAHGRSKDALFLTCIESEVERLLDRIYEAETRTRELTARHQIGALALAIIEHAHEDPAAARLLHTTARHHNSTVALDVDAAIARIPARIAAALRHHTTPARAQQIATALLGAAAALALSNLPDALAGAPLLAEALSTVIEPTTPEHADHQHVQNVDVY